MTADDTVTRAAEVMIAHTRTSIEACHCGWGRDATELGKSHPEHIAQALADAGLLATNDAVPRADLEALLGRWQRTVDKSNPLSSLGRALFEAPIHELREVLDEFVTCEKTDTEEKP